MYISSTDLSYTTNFWSYLTIQHFHLEFDRHLKLKLFESTVLILPNLPSHSFAEKSDVIIIFVLLYVRAPYSLMTSFIFFICLWFPVQCSFVLFSFILLGVLLDSWICGSVAGINFGKISVILH